MKIKANSDGAETRFYPVQSRRRLRRLYFLFAGERGMPRESLWAKADGTCMSRFFDTVYVMSDADAYYEKLKYRREGSIFIVDR